MWEAESRLYLYPEDSSFIADLNTLKSLLSGLQFIEKKLDGNRYSTGNNFVSLLTFMGCSPNQKAPFKVFGNQILCPNCNEKIDSRKINWRKSAFVASSWICIGNIYELESVPSDFLLSELQKETGLKWKPTYIRAISTH